MSKISKVLTFGFLVFACVSPVFGQPETAKNTIVVQNEIEADLKSYIPQIHEDLIIERLKCLEKNVPLPYNPIVGRQIERFFVKQRGQVQYYLMRKDRYFPIFEEVLAKYGMPDELKYLAVVESSLIPKARSWASAVGLWQFMPFTGREYGLAQDFYIDERVDPYKATEAAAKFLKSLYERFGDWHLALAAYNSGAGRVQQAIRRSGGKRTFWEIYPYLPNETKAYVPIFIAVNYVFNYHQEHYTEMPKEYHGYIAHDTIQTNQFVNLKELAKQLEIDFDMLLLLNPQLKKNVVPRHYKNFVIRIPKEKSEYFATNREDILESCKKGTYQPIPYPAYTESMIAASTKGKKKQVHQVKKGEILGNIAKKYAVETNDLMAWNKLRGQNLYASQRLVVWVSEPKVTEQKEQTGTKTEEIIGKNDDSKQKHTTPIKTVSMKPSTAQRSSVVALAKASKAPAFYVVRPGDTLWNISQKHRGLSVDKIKQLNPSLKGDNLVTGQKIRVS